MPRANVNACQGDVSANALDIEVDGMEIGGDSRCGTKRSRRLAIRDTVVLLRYL